MYSLISHVFGGITFSCEIERNDAIVANQLPGPLREIFTLAKMTAEVLKTLLSCAARILETAIPDPNDLKEALRISRSGGDVKLLSGIREDLNAYQGNEQCLRALVESWKERDPCVFAALARANQASEILLGDRCHSSAHEAISNYALEIDSANRDRKRMVSPGSDLYAFYKRSGISDAWPFAQKVVYDIERISSRCLKEAMRAVRFLRKQANEEKNEPPRPSEPTREYCLLSLPDRARWEGTVELPQGLAILFGKILDRRGKPLQMDYVTNKFGGSPSRKTVTNYVYELAEKLEFIKFPWTFRTANGVIYVNRPRI